MPSILELREVEKLIESVASKYPIDGTEFEDRVQIARIAVWELLQEHPITVENLSQYRGHIWTSASQAISREYRKTKAQKRPELSKGLSFDAPLGDEDDRTLADLIASDEATPLDVLIEKEGQDWRLALDVAKRESFRLRTPKSKRLVMLALVELLGLTPEDAPKKISYKTFVDNGLDRWLWIFFNNSPFRAINHAYPGRFLGSDMARAPQRYWIGKGGRCRAIRALREVLEKTGYPPERYPTLLTNRFFEEFKLTTPLCKLFGWDRFAYLDAAFPGQYYPWELSITPKGYFDSPENVVKAVRWLMEEKLDIPLPELTVGEVWDRRVALVITKQTFSEYGLREIMAIYKSPEPVLRIVYPDKFLPWSFQRKGKWMGVKGRWLAAHATRWLLEEHLQISPFSPEVNWKLFIDNGLHGMITCRSLGFNSSPAAVLKNAYPRFPSSF